MSRTYRRKPYTMDWQERGDKRFFEKVHNHGDKTHKPQCRLCGRNDSVQRTEKRVRKRNEIKQELRNSQ